MFQKLNLGAKIGLLKMTAAGLLMLVLFMLGKMIPGVTFWIFAAGIVVTIVSSLFLNKDND